MRFFCRIFVVFSIVLLFFLETFAAASPAPEKEHRILFISAYSPEFPTFYEFVDGIESVFASAPVAWDLEFMDSKRFYDVDYLKTFHQLISYKLAHLPPYDLLIVADDNALSFALHYQKSLFKGLPIVFCGVNNVAFALEQNDNPLVTGIVETSSLHENLQLILQIHPDTRKILALEDGSEMGRGSLSHLFLQEAQNFPTVEFELFSLSQYSFEEYFHKLSRMEDTTKIISFPIFKDKTGAMLSPQQAMKQLIENASQPIYGLWSWMMGKGIFGGLMVSCHEQGAVAAKMALEILNGKPIEELPVIDKSSNQYMFDYQLMQRFGIDEQSLPAGSQVINRPFSFYQSYKGLVWATISAFILLLALVVVMLINIVHRRRVEQELASHKETLEQQVSERTAELRCSNRELLESQKRNHALADAAFEGIVFTIDDQILDANAAFAALLGVPLSELAGRSISEFFSREEWQKISAVAVPQQARMLESCCLNHAGQKIILEAQSKEFIYHEQQVKVTAVRDIRERKKAEEEIRVLRGILPLCCYCKKVRDDDGYWQQVDVYLSKYSEADISHGICPDCLKKDFPEVYEQMMNKEKTDDPQSPTDS